MNQRLLGERCSHVEAEERVVGTGAHLGQQLGIMPPPQALAIAKQKGLDLVEISPTAQPPVCRIMDFGKFKYEQDQRKKESRKKASNVVVKEMKFRPKIDAHDYDTKMKSVHRFFEEGDKVKVTLRFRGREMAHQDIGVRMLERLKQDLEPYGQVEQFPKVEGRQMVMVLAPVKKK